MYKTKRLFKIAKSSILTVFIMIFPFNLSKLPFTKKLIFPSLKILLLKIAFTNSSI